jgi:hypothetical protein
MDHVLEYMKENKIPMTRKNYITLVYMDPKKELSAEEEAELPEQFQQTAPYIAKPDRRRRYAVIWSNVT